MPKITVDGKIIDVPKGRTVLQALDDLGLLMNGVDIPHYCWHPKLSIDGSCRLCQIEVEGMPKLQVACSVAVEEGMGLLTDTERVQNTRRAVWAMLLFHPPLARPGASARGGRGFSGAVDPPLHGPAHGPAPGPAHGPRGPAVVRRLSPG